MLLQPRFWAVASRVPFLFHGDTLHHVALKAAFQRRFELAETLFEAAATRYRRDLDIPRLARLRVHQLIARARDCQARDHDAVLELAVEIERRLRSLDDIEDLSPPFALIGPAEMLAEFREASSESEPLPAAA
jgi:hypothetical protein